MTLEETIRTLEAVALQQQSVAMVIDNDIFKLNAIPNAKYAVFAYTQGEHLTSVSGDLATYRLTLFYVDRLLADKSNQTQIQSTGTQVLRNILTMMSELDFQVDNMPIQPFTQQFVDECAGVYCSVAIGAANGCECMPGFTEVSRKLNAATDKANEAASAANTAAESANSAASEATTAAESATNASQAANEAASTADAANESFGTSILTGVPEQPVTAAADSVTLSLNRRTRETATGQFGGDTPLPITLPVATEATAGLMSATDKASLDGMPQQITDAVSGEAEAREAADTTLQGNIDTKLSIDTYNADKLTFATKDEIGAINDVLDNINGEII